MSLILLIYEKSIQFESFVSSPSMTLNKEFRSSTFLAIGPITSLEDAYNIYPNLDNLPYEGFNEYSPQQWAGYETEPPVSVPNVLLIINWT